MKHRTKQALSWLLSLALMLSLLPGMSLTAYADETKVGDATYTINNGVLTVGSGSFTIENWASVFDTGGSKNTPNDTANSIKSVVFQEGAVLTSTSMKNMFRKWTALESADLTNLKASAITDMSYLFGNCSKLTSVTFGAEVKTSNVKTMERMFWNCSSLTDLDLSTFKAYTGSEKRSLYQTFNNCSKLVTIRVSDDWNVENAEGNQTFDGCWKLVGGNGTECGYNGGNYSYAIIDGKDNKQGYLTSANAAAVHRHEFTYSASGNTLSATCSASDCTLENSKVELTLTAPAKTVYGDSNSAEATLNGIDTFKTETGWNGTYSSVTYYSNNSTVQLGSAPKTPGEYTAKVTIQNISYKSYTLTADYTIAQKEIGLTWADTTFHYDGKSHVPTATATGLVGSDECDVTVTGEQTAIGNYTATASGLSNDRYKLPENNTIEFAIEGWVGTARYTIEEAPSPKKLFAAKGISHEITNGVLTIYGGEFNNADWKTAFANDDFITNTRDKITSVRFVKANDEDTAAKLTDSAQGMFQNWAGLKTIDFTNLDTSSVTWMGTMFSGCSSLTELDLSPLDTSEVTNMAAMFQGCSSLAKIVVGDKWDTSKVTTSTAMFNGCNVLAGNAGTTYQGLANGYIETDPASLNIGGTYAHIDGGRNNPGLLYDSHVHHFIYAVAKDAPWTITATCNADGCYLGDSNNHSVSISLVKPTLYVYYMDVLNKQGDEYDKGASPFATLTMQNVGNQTLPAPDELTEEDLKKLVNGIVTGISISVQTFTDANTAAPTFEELTGATIGDIEYYEKGSDTKLDNAPTDAGTYTAKITIGGQTASVDYRIYKRFHSPVLTSPTKNPDFAFGETVQDLIIPGTIKQVDDTDTSTFEYALGTNATAIPTQGWSKTIPTGSGTGPFYVFYRVAGDKNHGNAMESEFPNKTGYAITDKPEHESNSYKPAFSVIVISNTLPNPPTPKELTYNGQDQALVEAGSATNGKMQYALGEIKTDQPSAEQGDTKAVVIAGITSYVWKTGDWSDTVPQKTEPGVYYVLYRVVSNDNTQAQIGDIGHVMVTLGKAELTVTAPTATATYGQTLANVSLTNPTGNPEGTWAWVDATTTSVGDVGTNAFKAKFTPTDTTHYKAVEVDVNVTVGNATLTGVSVAQDGTLTYTGEAQTPEVTAAATAVNNQAVTFTYSDTENGTYSTTVPSVTTAGSHTIYYKASAPNHDDVTGNFDVTVNKATPTVGDFTYTAPSDLAYNGTAKSATVAAKSGITGMGTVAVKYYSDAECTTEVQSPTNVGTYYVGITVAEGTNYSASSAVLHGGDWQFTINKATPAVDDFTYTAPSELTYNGTAKTATVVAKDSIDGMGQVTVKYYSDATCTIEVEPKNVGTYYVGITVADGDNYSEVSTALHGESWTFTITKATPASPTGVTVTRTVNTITVTAPEQVNSGTEGSPVYKYEYGYRVKPDDDAANEPSYTWGVSAEFTGLTPSTTYQVVVREKETANYNAGTPSDALAVTTLPIFTMTGTARYGRELTATNLTAANGRYSYQWYRVNGGTETAISDATESAYTISSAEDIGKTLRVKVTVDGTDAINTGVIPVDSAVVEVGLYTTPVLSVSKTTVTETTIKIDGFENYREDGKYQYSIDGGTTWTPFPSPFEFPLVISGLTGNTTYSIVVQGVKVESDKTTVIEAGTPSLPLTVKTPAEVVALTGVSINGTPQVGSTLTAVVTGEDGKVPTGVTYQWYRVTGGSESMISGATGAAYTLTSADFGERIKVTATGVNSAGDPTSKNATTTDTVTAVPAADLTGRAIRTTATQTTITVLGFSKTSTRHYEYACVAGTNAAAPTEASEWQSDAEFTGLEENTTYTVFVRTGGAATGTAWQATGTAISKNVQTLALPLPYTGAAPTVTMYDYIYGAASTPLVSDTLVTGATKTYEYRKLGATGWTPGTPGDTLAVGTYEIRAKITAEGCSDYTTATTNFAVKQAPLTAPTVSADGVTVTVSESVPTSKKVQYVVVDHTDSAADLTSAAWKSATLDNDSKFELTGLQENYDYDVYVRSVPASTESNYTLSDWSAKGTGKTPETKTVVYDLNGGKVKSGRTFALTATFTAASYTLANGSAIERPGYTFEGWKLNNDGSAVTSATSGGTYVAQWTAKHYTVTFDPNNVTDTTTTTQTDFTYGVGKKLTNNTFTYTDHVFAGWATTKTGAVRYGDGQTVMNLTTGDSVTLYAVWGSATKVTGTITGAEGGVTEVTLKRGDIQIGETQIAALAYDSTNKQYTGAYTFTSVPDGIYNIVAVQNVERLDQDGNTFTEALTVTSVISIVSGAISGNANFTMPESDYSSIVSVSGTDTPPVVVGGLDTEAKESALDDRSVTVTMTVEKKEETTADVETKDAIEAIASTANAPTEERDYLNIDVKKEITKNGQSESEEAVTETAQLIDITIPYDLSGKSNAQISLYRFHDGEATKLGTSSNDTSYYTLDRTNNLIVLHTKLFSTYAIGYNPDVTDPDSGSNDNNGGSVGGAGGTQAANETANGTFSVAPQNAKSGETVTITVKPNEGYEADTVTVTDANGKAVSVTKVNDTTYTFTQPTGKVKIDVTFKPDVDLSKFVDVDVSAWYAEAIRWAVKNNVMNGVSPKYFNPNGDTTRAMVVTMLWRMEGSPAYAGASEFTDVDADTWYTEAVRWASTEGIVTGYENPDDAGMIFNPNGAVTREQLATMLHRYAQYKKADVSMSASLSSYGDAASVSSWATSAMQWAVGSGIINGIDGNLASVNHATRAQVATMLMRYSTAK